MLGPSYTQVGQIKLANLSSGQMTTIDSSIVSISIDYSMTMASELRFTVIDFNNEMTKRNYFSIGRDVIYTTHTACPLNENSGVNVISSKPSYINLLFEIADVTISQGPGNTPQVEVACYSKAVQQMKRDRKPGEIKGIGSEYVKRAARKYGLRCFAEKSSKKVTINKASGDEQAESLWDVLSGIATESKFMLFEADGILFFASQKFLLNKWGSNSVRVEQKNQKGKPPKYVTERSVPIVNWKDSWSVNQGSIFSTTATAPAFDLIEYPTFTRSANDPLDVTGSFSIARENGSKLRPGMTIQLIGFPGEVDDKYLVDSVSFADREPDPVQVSFRKPEKKPKDIKEIAIGKKLKLGLNVTREFIEFDIVRSKNSKNNRPNTQLDISSKMMGFSSADLPPNKVVDPRALPAPTILNQQIYPRFDSIGTYYPSRSQIIYAGLPADLYPVNPTGLLVPGNIPLTKRPLVFNSTTQETSTLLSFSFGADGYEIVIPQVIDGVIAAQQQAIDYYNATGQHLGKFASGDTANASAYAESLHQIQESWMHLVNGYKGRNKLLQTGNVKMYSRTTKVIDGKLQTIVPLIVENVTEPGFNDDNPYVAIIPRLSSSGEPFVESEISASTSFISDMAYNIEAEFIAKLTDRESATDYVKLINHQQAFVLSSRFKDPEIPDTCIYPLPTEGDQQNYPYMSTLVEQGNIDLYSLPAGRVSGIPTTFYPYFFKNGANVIIVSGLRQSGDKVEIITQKQALKAYASSGKFFGKCPPKHAEIYALLLAEQQEILINQRFNGDYSGLGDL